MSGNFDAAVIEEAIPAGQAAIHLAASARRVTLVVRGERLERMSDYLVQQIHHAPNIEVRLGAEVVGAEGKELMESLRSGTPQATSSKPFQRDWSSS